MMARAETALHGVLDSLSFLPPEVGRDLQRIDLVRLTGSVRGSRTGGGCQRIGQADYPCGG